MNEIANQLVQVLFKKNSLQDCSRWELEILADKYPYFGVAQLLVSGKLKEENDEAYEKQVQKTSLYFTNPLWLDYILNKKTANGNVIEEKKELSTFSDEAKNEVLNPAIEEVVINDPVLHTEEILPIATIEQVTEDKSDEDTEEIISTSEQQGDLKIAPLKVEPFDENAKLSFEPYHTVDYFASQGIKLSLEEKPQDKFGQQLKSFTQWLKTIKKTPATELSKEAGKGTEQKVITLAEHSIEDREVVTEPMAEVWAKQGNKEKAIRIYEKLSLQNPAKSSYFAGLIEQLKQH